MTRECGWTRRFNVRGRGWASLGLVSEKEAARRRGFGRWSELEAYRRNVFLLSSSRLISITGSIAAYVALVTVLYSRSQHSGTWVAAGLVVSMAVTALAGPWAGSLGDR